MNRKAKRGAWGAKLLGGLLIVGVNGAGATPPPDPVSYGAHFFPASTTGLTATSVTISGQTRSALIYKASTIPPGVSPPLLIFFSGTGAILDWNTADELGRGNLVTFANSNQAVIIFPMPLEQTYGDWDNHSSGTPYWQTADGSDGDADVTNDPVAGNPDTNPDLLFTRVLIKEAVTNTAYNVNPDRVYTNGFSNGAFFSYFAAAVLNQRIAAFAATGGGLVLSGTTGGGGCSSTPFAGAPNEVRTCAAAGWTPMTCVTGAAMRPIAPTAVSRIPPAYLEGNDDDSSVPYPHTCNLLANLPSGTANVTRIVHSGIGHAINGENMATMDPGYLQRSWDFMIGAGSTPSEPIFLNGFED